MDQGSGLINPGLEVLSVSLLGAANVASIGPLPMPIQESLLALHMWAGELRTLADQPIHTNVIQKSTVWLSTSSSNTKLSLAGISNI
jgi:hypothetical protein